jgi:hypothetical protein
MSLTLTAAVVAAIAAIVGGLLTAVVGPLVKHKLELKRADIERKRGKIHAWRELVGSAAREFQEGRSIKAYLESQPSFHDLMGHLPDSVIEEVSRESRIFVVESSMQHPLSLLSHEVSKLERKWGLASDA